MAKTRGAAARKTTTASEPYQEARLARRARAPASVSSRSTAGPSTTSGSTSNTSLSTLDVEEAAPQKDVLRTMGRCKAAKVIGADGTSTHYEVGDEVYVAPPHATLDGSGDLDERQLWRAKILHIRVPDRDHPTLVWMVIDWYWAPTEFTQLKKSFNPRLCGYNEIIYVSNKTDVVSCASLNGHANVHAYDDADHLRLGQISESEYYCRTEYDNTHKRFKRETIPSCVCRKKYVPDDERTMVLCPRSTCLNWYHTACLERHDMRYYPSEASELEALWASTQDDGSLETFAKELEQCWAVSELNDSKRSDTDEDLHALQQIAHRPCMRGGPYGIVGNAGVVLRARYLLELVLKDEVEMWSNWRDFVWGEGGAWRMPRFEHMRHHSEEGEGQVVSYACPSCSRPI